MHRSPLAASGGASGLRMPLRAPPPPAEGTELVSEQVLRALGRLSLVAIAGSGVLALSKGNLPQFITLSVLAAGALVVVLFNLTPAFECALLVVLGVQAVARLLGLPLDIPHWDEGAHLVSSATATPVAYLMLVRLGLTLDPRHVAGPGRALGLLVLGAGCGLGLGAAWELFEWGADEVVGTNYSIGYTDTVTDLAADAFGAAAGALGLVVYGLSSGSSHTVRP